MQTDIKFFCHFACYSVALSDIIRQNFQSLTTKTTDLNDRDFLIRMLYKDCYWLFAEHKTPIWTMYMYVGLCDVQYFVVTTLL